MPSLVCPRQTVEVANDMLTVARELAEVTRLVEDDDFGTTLDRFLARIVGGIPGCDAAILTVRDVGSVETVGGAEPFDVRMPGPVVESVTFVEPRRLDDIATDERWPLFGARMKEAGLHCCLALPLSTRRQDAAVLTLFSRTPDQFADTAYDVVLLLALHAGVAFDNAALYRDSKELVGQLRTALRTRSLVGRAQGLLMRHYDYDSEHAFDALRTASQRLNIKLREIARRLVDAHERDALRAELAALGFQVTAGKRHV
jgi:GAF domain-containing protein